MLINRNNYELILIDYFDGKLNAVETACLMAFLEENPDIREECDLYREVHLEKCAPIEFDEKSQLKRTIIPEKDLITEFNYLQIFFEDEEGTLDGEMQDHLKSFLYNNPSLLPEYFSWRDAHLIPEELIFDRKAQLKKSTFFMLHRREFSFAGMAAALALLIMAGTLFLGIKEPQPLPAQAFQPAQTQSLSRLANRPAVLNSNEQRVKPDATAYGDPKNIQKSEVQEIPREVLFASNTKVDKMIAKSAISGLTDQLAEAPRTILDSQSEYTEILQLATIRQKIKTGGERAVQGAGNTNQPNDDSFNKVRVSFWDIAEKGVAGYNALADKDIQYNRRINSQGRTSAIRVGSFAYEKK